MIKYFIVYLFSCLLCFIIFELILGVFDYFIYGQFTGGGYRPQSHLSLFLL